MALQIRRGLQANLPASPADGELLYATDTGNLYIGVSGSPSLISFGSGGGGNSNVNAISDLTDVASVSGISDGQALLWNSANSQFEYGDIPAGYANSDVQAFLASGTLTGHIIPGANITYDLGSDNLRFRDLYLSGQTIKLGSIEITQDGAGNVSFGTANVKGGPQNSPFATDNELEAANNSMRAYVDALENRVVGGANVSLDSLAEVANALANSNTQLSTVAFTGNYSDITNKPATMALNANTYLTYDGANIDLTTVVGQVGPKGDTGNTGPQGVSVSSAALTGDNLILTLSDASTIDAGNVRGEQGPQGAQGNVGPQGDTGAEGVSVSSAAVTGSNLILTLSNTATIDAGNVVGPQGATGPQGDGNAGISSATVTAGDLILTLNDATTVNAGNVVGPQGATGVGITSTSLVGGNLILNYSNTSTQNVGNIQGPQGDQGATGATGATISSASVTNGAITLTMSDSSTVNVTGNVQGSTGPQGPQGNVGPAGADGTNVSSASVNGSGNLILTLSDASTIDAGNVRGADGEVDQTLSIDNTSNVITISGSNSTVDLTTVLQKMRDTDTDAQDLSITGNVISLTGQSGNVDLTSLLGAYVNTDSQTLTLTGNTLSISGGNNVDLSSFAGGGGIADLSSNVLADLGDVSSTAPSDGQALVWDNGNSVWAPGTVSSGGGGSQNLFANVAVSGQNTITADSTTDTLTFAAGSGISITTNSTTDTVTFAATGGGGGGSGAVVERFKLNYATNGNLDSTSDLSSGINSVSIDSATSGEVSITFSGYNYPPASVMIYGYDYANNKYYISHVETTMATREIAGGGSSGSPTLFDGASTPVVKLRLRETETGASRSFGTTTHAWIHIVMYD